MNKTEHENITMPDRIINETVKGVEMLGVIAERLSRPGEQIVNEFSRRLFQRILQYISPF